jgi:hypothetical protein
MKTKSTLIQICLLGALLLALPAVVQAQFNYTTANGAITITGYTGSDNTVIIPGTINGLPVTSIGDYAFEYDTFTNVTIPDSVTDIVLGAFVSCGGLMNITIGNHVANIGGDAFILYENLSSVTIPDSVTNIGGTAFDDCINLTSIGSEVFGDCRSLTNLAIGTNVTSIGVDAFLQCVLLPSITISKSITNIGESAFADFPSLTGITVNAANPTYSSVDGVLVDKNRTTLIEYPGGRSESYTVPSGVTSIGDTAFEGCNDLTGIIIPNSVTNIDSSRIIVDRDQVFRRRTGYASGSF